MYVRPPLETSYPAKSPSPAFPASYRVPRLVIEEASLLGLFHPEFDQVSSSYPVPSQLQTTCSTYLPYPITSASSSTVRLIPGLKGLECLFKKKKGCKSHHECFGKERNAFHARTQALYIKHLL